MLFPSFFSLSIRKGEKEPFVKFVPPPPDFFCVGRESAPSPLLLSLLPHSPCKSGEGKSVGKNLSRKNRFFGLFRGSFYFRSLTPSTTELGALSLSGWAWLGAISSGWVFL